MSDEPTHSLRERKHEYFSPMSSEDCTTGRTYCLPGRSDESRKRQVNGNRSRCLGFLAIDVESTRIGNICHPVGEDPVRRLDAHVDQREKASVLKPTLKRQSAALAICIKPF
jgi:hypothetical protein